MWYRIDRKVMTYASRYRTKYYWATVGLATNKEDIEIYRRGLLERGNRLEDIRIKGFRNKPKWLHYKN